MPICLFERYLPDSDMIPLFWFFHHPRTPIAPSALRVVVKKGYARCVTLLLRSPLIDPNATLNSAGHTCLMLAVDGGEYEIDTVRALLADERIDVNKRDRRGWTALLQASLAGHRRIVAALLAHPRIEVNVATELGATPLFYAAKHGWVESVRVLVERGADVNAQTKNGATALSRAAALVPLATNTSMYNQLLAIVDFLLDQPNIDTVGFVPPPRQSPAVPSDYM